MDPEPDQVDSRGVRRRALGLRLAAVLLTLACASAFEQVLAAFDLGRGGLVTERGWVFRPRSHAEFVSAEFRHRVVTSSQGLRDRDYALPAPAGTVRVAVVGDSLTYGYGVEAEETWVKALERQLRASFSGRTVEVVNLGKPGGDPNAYLPVCEAALPRLRPDLLLVGLTQGDDLTQLALLNPGGAPAKRPDLFARLAAAAFPVTVTHLKALAKSDDHELLAALRDQARGMTARFDAAALARYRSLDPETRGLFEHGLINPVLVDTACRFPDFYGPTLDPRSPTMAAAARALPATLKRFAALCGKTGTPWAVVSVPHGVYVSPEVLAGRRRLGYRAADGLLRTDVPESIAAACCREAGVPFLTVTDAVRRLRSPGAYFALDGHPTAAGHEQFARLLAPHVAAQFAALARGRGDGPTLVR